MRIIRELQRSLQPRRFRNTFSEELQRVSEIIDEIAEIEEVLVMIRNEVTQGASSKTGAGGMTSEQILRAGFLRARFGHTYRQLEMQTQDSTATRDFLKLRMGQYFSRSTLQYNLSRVSEGTWLHFNELILRYAVKKGIEDGTIIRGDTTATATNIHHPTDSSLLVDGVRVLSRTLGRLKEMGVDVSYCDHHRRAKKKLYKINNIKSEAKRRPHYLELIRVGRMTQSYARAFLNVEGRIVPMENRAAYDELVKMLNGYSETMERVIYQAYRRIVLGEKVDAQDKVLSFFEPHTDIVVKGQRDTIYGHKVAITAGRLLVLNCTVLDGNPCDTTTLKPMIEDHTRTYGIAPTAAAFDGGFASVANRDFAKAKGVEELTFSNNGKMELDTLVSGKEMHKILVRFRAGVEGVISFLKRIFGFDRVYDKGESAFKAALQRGAVAFNLLAIARATLT